MTYCKKLVVTAIIAKENRIVSAGKNNPINECNNTDCHVDGHCINTVHAEAAAIIKAGSKARGATLFVSHEPCWQCRKIIIAAEIKTVVYYNAYPNPLNERFVGDVEWIHETGEGLHDFVRPVGF
ncbi:deaminase [Geomicrobium sp. JCM 19055]|uniref:deoxycytidylate deaminase n=1 Tax=Geomicrobium sp. JCM 19055 TaxID=1460649 RepID=UPI0006941260|nr:deaminase [Geomicrobium sp. JCM 19055]